ncbi:MAG: ubiquinol-cytochrome C chaperone family protein [Rhodospirillales bacterium]|nr:ubiquinol-cytochrome C chaperone family protein [Alphaproteobacteria bacterium]MCB9987176.1 ubiquinol-cytochrome C chaperone family protein [Rhodospirillales bacterium]USO07960.1 MAG: ubiquinol-cytochrome C chaperone family protein [Rhodospirillales bacterium]
MFTLLKRQKAGAAQGDVAALFEAALAASRNPALYRDYGVPDTFDGRFDALLLHLVPMFRQLAGDEKAAQALYDLVFRRLELALRESGAGDLGVARQVRAMMKAFYGRMVAYGDCQTDTAWREALTRNLYGTVPGIEVPDGMVVYARNLMERKG